MRGLQVRQLGAVTLGQFLGLLECIVAAGPGAAELG